MNDVGEGNEYDQNTGHRILKEIFLNKNERLLNITKLLSNFATLESVKRNSFTPDFLLRFFCC